MTASEVSQVSDKHRTALLLARAADFRDPTRITTILKVALWVSIAADAVAIGSGLLELQLLQDVQAGEITSSTMDSAHANELRHRIVGWIQLAVLTGTVIAFSRWIFVVNDNKRRLGASGLRFTPAWAVGWFFVPVAHFWKPYEAMKEVWQVSADPFLWRDQIRGSLLPWWWFFWLAGNIIVQAVFWFGPSAKALSIATTVANGASIAAAFAAMALVGQISRMQLDRKRRWDAVIGHDDQVAGVIEKLHMLGQEWVNKFLSSYLSMNDRAGLPDLVRGVIADARAEEENKGKIGEKQVPCDLDPLDGRAGPYEYRGRNFYSYPDGRVDGYTRSGGWWRFLSLHEFKAQVDGELDRVR